MAQTPPAQPELSVTVARRTPRFVLDPGVCLSALGPMLVERLQCEAELWLPRELWRILDNSHYFYVRPQALFQTGTVPADACDYERALRDDFALNMQGVPELAPSADVSPRSVEIQRTFEAWESIRMSRDLAGLRLFWLGDGLSESLVPAGSAENLHLHFEQVAEHLDLVLKPCSPMACGQRDALALAIALRGTPILGRLDGASERPALCSLAQAAFVAREITESDAYVALERAYYQSMLVRAQCAPLMWSALELAIFHVSAPYAISQYIRCGSTQNVTDAACDEPHELSQAALYWYRL